MAAVDRMFVIGSVQTSTPEIIDWNIPVHPQKIVK